MGEVKGAEEPGWKGKRQGKVWSGGTVCRLEVSGLWKATVY